MAYEVLARKWRPKQFEDVVGQEHVTQTLTRAIESGRIAHAYLFIGPRGIGKTTLSRIFAKALSCEKGPTPTPCDECESCKAIAAGSSLDVIEIDGASNNKVEDAQAVLDQVKYPPARGRFKIFIVDEVHMLTTAAFNAALAKISEGVKVEDANLTVGAAVKAAVEAAGLKELALVYSAEKSAAATAGCSKIQDAYLPYVACALDTSLALSLIHI